MAELFKENLSLAKVHELGHRIAQRTARYRIQFDEQKFKRQLSEFAIEQGEDDWSLLSLMQRLRAAANALHQVMPQAKGADVIVETLAKNKDISGWLSLICCEYVGIHQQLTLEQGLDKLKQMTEYFSAEFAIRHFILRQPEQVLAVLYSWLDHDNHHVRRLVSEGTRPRLPWGVRLPIFIEQPELVLPLLLALRDDPEEYVRRSVANHLNDIAKDHTALVIETAQNWLSESELQGLSSEQKSNRIKLIRHACRTLFKQGQSEVMALFGYQPAGDVGCTLSTKQSQVPFGGIFEFEMMLVKSTAKENLLMVDYVMHFQKSNGKQAPKVFKWLDRQFDSAAKETVSKKHSFKKISTRKYYPGIHKLEIMVNGIKKSEIEFELLEPTNG